MGADKYALIGLHRRVLEPLLPQTLRPQKIPVLGEMPKNLAGKVLLHMLQDPGWSKAGLM